MSPNKAFGLVCATASHAALAPPPMRDENGSSGSRNPSPGRWHFTRRGLGPRIDLRSGGTVTTIFAFAGADLQVSLSPEEHSGVALRNVRTLSARDYGWPSAESGRTVAVVIAVRIGTSVLVAMATIAIAGCGGSSNSASGSGNTASDAKTYVHTISTDAAQVQADEIKVGLDIVHNDVTGLAQDAQTAHDDFVNVKTDIVGAGANVGDNSRLGNAEYQMDDAINELKNGMGAVVAFAENPNAGTLGAANSKLSRGITEWDQAATVLWTMAGRESEIPTLAGTAPATTSPSAATTSTTTPNPPSSSVPSWVQAAKKGCPAGEVLLKTLSNGEPAPHGNDGCVGSGSGECSTSEPTCDPANAPGGTPTTQTTTSTTAPAPPPPPPPSTLPPTATPAAWTNSPDSTCTEGAEAVTTINDEDVLYCASTDNISHVLCWEMGVSATSGGQTLGYDVKPGPQPMCPGAEPLR